METEEEMTFEEFLKQINNSKLVFLPIDDKPPDHPHCRCVILPWDNGTVSKITIKKNIVRDEEGNIIGVVSKN